VSRKVKILTFAGICLVILLSWASVWLYRHLPGPGIALPYKEVESFSQAEAFAASFLGRTGLQMEILGLSGWRISPTVTDSRRIRIVRKRDWAFHPDGQRAYVCYDKRLLEYAASGDLRAARVEDIDLGQEFWFMYIVGVGADTLLISLADYENLETGQVNFETILELSLSNWPSVVTLHKLDFFSMAAYDAERHRLFIVDVTEGTIGEYDLNEKRIVAEHRIDVELPYGFIDYHSAWGLLLSDWEWNRKSRIVLFSPKTGEAREITKGVYAKWSKNGNIYFVRGSEQLWRYNLLQEIEEPVYLFSRNTSSSDRDKDRLWFGGDRSFLIFYYSGYSIKGDYRFGKLLLDLEQEQYKDIREGSDGRTFLSRLFSPRKIRTHAKSKPRVKPVFNMPIAVTNIGKSRMLEFKMEDGANSCAISNLDPGATGKTKLTTNGNVQATFTAENIPQIQIHHELFSY
jgi:hypothetical protein